MDYAEAEAGARSIAIVIFAHLLQTASILPTDVSALERAISALESDISALERAINVLENSSVPWEHSLPWFTALVVVGVVMEWWVIGHEWRDEMEAWALAYFWAVRSPGRPSIRKLLAEAGSVLLIALGIMGELGAGLKIASINNSLRGKSAELRSKNAELRNKSDQLVALLGQQTAKLELANRQLTALIQPRTVSEADRKQLGEELMEFAPGFKGRKIKISSQTGDAEGMVFSLEIMDILTRAGIDVDPAGMGAIITVHAVAMGVIVRGPPGDREFIRALVGALNAKLATNLGTSVYGEWKPEYTEILVMVGVKPIVGLPKDWLHRNP